MDLVCAEALDVESLEDLARRLQPWWQEHGTRFGAKSGAVRFLFGDDAPAGGYFWNVTMEAIALLEAEEKMVKTSTSTSTPQYVNLPPLPPRDI